MKKGISLIVLVITIIVMIILAATVVISLTSNSVVDRANRAVDLTNEASVQDLAAIIWADTYIDGLRGDRLIEVVETKLEEQGVKKDKWNITIKDTGVTVTNKNTTSGVGLGTIITAENYGDKVDYSVTVNGTKYSDWQIYYHNSEYVYLIAGKSVGVVSLDKATTVASLTEKEKEIYEKFIVENDDKYVLVDEVNGSTSYNSQAIAKLIKDYTVFANTDVYGTNVVGAIGGPTLELLAAGWNAKKYTPTMTLTKNVYGYKITNGYFVDAASDGLYIAPNYYYWLASPSAYANNYVMCAGFGGVGGGGNSSACDIRPVVCLKASIPATVSTGDYSFSLIK